MNKEGILSVRELNYVLRKLQNGEGFSSDEEIGVFSQVDIVFVAGIFLWYRQHQENWNKIPPLFKIRDNDNAWNHSHYFKQIHALYDVSCKDIFTKFPNALNPQANVYSDFSVPPIYINRKSITLFFEMEEANERIDSIVNRYIDRFNVSDFVDARYSAYKNAESDFLFLQEDYVDKLSAVSPVFVFVFVVVCKRLSSREKWDAKETKEFIDSIWRFTDKYVNGIYELAKNIVEHSGNNVGEGQGMITIRAYRGMDAGSKVLETHIFDYGNKGICTTLRENTKKLSIDPKDYRSRFYREDLEILEKGYKLKDLMEPTSNKLLKQQLYREIAHYGLMSFSLLNKKYEGKFMVSSITHNGTGREFYSSDEKMKQEEYDIKIGTSYYYEMPFNRDLYQEIAKSEQQMLNTSTGSLTKLKRYEFIDSDNIQSINVESDKKYIIDLKVRCFFPEGEKRIENRNDEDLICDKIMEILTTRHAVFTSGNCPSIDLDRIKLGKSSLLRILARISYQNSFSHFIVYNVSADVFKGLVEDNERWFTTIKGVSRNDIDGNPIKYWFDDKSVLLFSMYEKDKDRFYFSDILFGDNVEKFESINKIIANTFPNITTFISKKENTIPSEQSPEIPEDIKALFFYAGSNCLLPFDTIFKSQIVNDKGEKEEIELFRFNIRTILQNKLPLAGESTNDTITNYVENIDGYHIADTHFKIGNKVHSSDFYYAKRFFQDSFYTMRLAFYMAKKISEDYAPSGFDNRRLILVGYEMYSDLLLSLVNKFMQDIYEYQIAGHVIVQNKDDSLSFLPQDVFKKYDSNQKCCIVILVPIAATGSTTKKIETEIRQSIETKIDDDNQPKNINIISYNLVLAKDPGKEFEGIVNLGNNSPVIDLRAKWHKLEDCTLCYGENDVTKPMFDTDSSSLTPAVIFENPKGKDGSKEKSKVESKAFDDLTFDNSIRYLSINRNDHYRIYSTNTISFIDDNKNELIEWLGQVKVYLVDELPENSRVRDSDSVILIAPCHESNMLFINLINEHVFNFSATIVHYQSGIDTPENFDMLNRRYLGEKNLKRFYVDDSLITGKHFFEIFDLLEANTSREETTLTGAIFLNDQSTLSIHERVAQSSNNLFTFASYNQPNAISFNHQPLERECGRYSRLQEKVLHDILQDYFLSKADKVNPEKRDKGDLSGSKIARRLKMFEATHKIYEFFSDGRHQVPDLTKKEERDNFVRFKREDGRMNEEALMKVLSQSPFVSYKGLKEATFKWLRETLANIYFPNRQEPFNYEKFSEFKFLMRRAVFLGDYEVLKQKFLSVLFAWFERIDSLRNQSSITLDERKKLLSFVVFSVGNYVEIAQKNPWTLYKLISEMKGLDFESSTCGKQFLNMLQIESANVIEDFVEVIESKYVDGWRNVYKDASDDKDRDKNRLNPNLEEIIAFVNDGKKGLLNTNKYHLVRLLFPDLTNDWNIGSTPFANYLWIKQLICADIDPYKYTSFGYQNEVDHILSKMKCLFPNNGEKIKAFFIVADAQHTPIPYIMFQDDFMLSPFYQETGELDTEGKGKELIVFLNGGTSPNGEAPETTVEYIHDGTGWKNIYKNNEPATLEFMPENYKWIYMVRISRLKMSKKGRRKFEGQGILGFACEENLSDAMLPKQLLMLLRRDMSLFISKHHDNDEFAERIREQEKDRYALKINHGVRTYKKAIEKLVKKCTDKELRDDLDAFYNYLILKMNLIEKVRADDAKPDGVTLQMIKDEFEGAYNRVLSLNIDNICLQKEKVSEIVKLQCFNGAISLDETFMFPKDSLKDIVFELLNNIRKNTCNRDSWKICEEDPLIIKCEIVQENGEIYLSVYNNHVEDPGEKQPDYSPHGIDLLRQMWKINKLGRIITPDYPLANRSFTIKIQLKKP
jgi:hypothetical protein